MNPSTTTTYNQEQDASCHYSYYDINDIDMNQAHQQQSEDCEMEDSCYMQYDLDVANAVAEADYQDYYCYNDYHSLSSQEDEDDNDYIEEEEDAEQPYDYTKDSLLELVVGVHSYLSEQADYNPTAKHDSPLYNLQYKMYSYMRQRAIELGVQL